MTVDVEGSTEDQVETNTQGQEVTTTATEEITDNDPMVASLKEAEAEIAKEAGTPEGTAEKTAAQGDPAATAAGAKAEEGKAPIMIPKARLDQEISKSNQYKDRTTFLEGVVATQQEMLKGGKSATGEEGKTAATETPDPVALITKAEDEKLVLAKKYEDGEISLVEFKQGEIKLDREIRTLADANTKALVEGVKKETTETIAANNKQMSVEDAAVQIQEQHPYVAEIDKLPDAIRDGIWTQITNEAAALLAAKGINVKDGSLASHVALMQEKARLTDTYGPRYTGTTLEKPNTDGKAKDTVSDLAIARGKKLDLAAQQPPETSGAGVGGNTQTELTEKDLEGMSQDQIADAIATRPTAVQKAAGFKNR